MLTRMERMNLMDCIRSMFAQENNPYKHAHAHAHAHKNTHAHAHACTHIHTKYKLKCKTRQENKKKNENERNKERHTHTLQNITHMQSHQVHIEICTRSRRGVEMKKRK